MTMQYRRSATWPFYCGGRPAAIAAPDCLRPAADRPYFANAQGRRFDVRAEGDVTEIELYDEIGFWGVTAKDFRSRLPASGDVRVIINSPGGDVFDGIAMFNDLRAVDGNVEVLVTGLAASAASIVAMAGDRLTMAESSFLMIHNAWTIMIGDRNEFRAVADVLEQIDTALARVYAERSGLERAAVTAMMDAETWMDGAAAVEAGFADEIVEREAPEARFDLSGFKNVPKTLRSRVETATAGNPTKRDMEHALMHDAGLSRSKARAVLRSGAKAVEATQDAGGDAEGWAALAAVGQKLKELTA